MGIAERMEMKTESFARNSGKEVCHAARQIRRGGADERKQIEKAHGALYGEGVLQSNGGVLFGDAGIDVGKNVVAVYCDFIIINIFKRISADKSTGDNLV